MAVWMNVFGENGTGRYSPDKANHYLQLLNSVVMDMTTILDSMIEAGYNQPRIRDFYKEHRESTEQGLRGMSVVEYRAYLNSINTPYMDVSALIDHWIEEGEQRETQLAADFDKAYNRSLTNGEMPQWEITQANNTEARFINNLGFLSGEYSGLRISLFSNMVCITGPSCIMSDYWTFPSGISDNSRNSYHNFFRQILGKFNSSYILYAHEWTGLYEDDDRELTSEELVSRLEMDRNTSLHHMGQGWFYERLLVDIKD